jgi:hypothetical protein
MTRPLDPEAVGPPLHQYGGGHLWPLVPGAGKEDLTKTRGPRACPGRTLTLAPGAKAGAKPGQTAENKGVTFKITPFSYQLVPKRGFEPRRGSPHWTLKPHGVA